MNDIKEIIKRAIQITRESDGLSPTGNVIHRICVLTGQRESWVLDELDRARNSGMIEEPKAERIKLTSRSII